MHLPKPLKEARRAPRVAVSYRTQAYGPRLERVDAWLVDISQNGCMIRCEADIVTEDLVTITLPLVSKWVGRVVWALGGRVGMEFVMPLPAEGYNSMLGEMNQDPRGMNGI